MKTYSHKSFNTAEILITVLVSILFEITVKAQDSPDIKSNTWFTSKEVAENVWQIEDHGNDNIFLVEGDEKALLIDAGLGVADLSSYVKSLINLPLIVVNTHAHGDHCGGDFQFEEIYIHPADSQSVSFYCNKKSHYDAVKRAADSSPELSDLLLHDEPILKSPIIHTVEEGYIFNLGNRELEVIEAPGHTKGSICLLDTKNKLIFTGDNNGTMVWLFPEKSLPLELYLESLLNLIKRSDEFTIILTGHEEPQDKDLLNEIKICAENILTGDCKGESYKTFVDYAKICKYKRARIAFDPDKLFVK